MEKMKIKERVNWPVTILLLLGLLTVAFPDVYKRQDLM